MKLSIKKCMFCLVVVTLAGFIFFQTAIKSPSLSLRQLSNDFFDVSKPRLGFIKEGNIDVHPARQLNENIINKM